jgi:hypothetical protein
VTAGLDALRRELIHTIVLTDDYADELLRQVVAIEAVIAARWPRSVVVRWRLARELRRSVRHIDGDDFTSRRLNTIATGWMERRP